MVSVRDSRLGISSKDDLDTGRWLHSLTLTRSPEEMQVIERACALATQAHAGQRRASGEPYFQHVLAVANILAELGMDHETIAAAILHDVAEDPVVAQEQI